MTNLTEKWKKGELPDGEYYCKTENGDEILRTWRGLNGYVSLENICDEVFIASMDDCEVLDKVPSHKEYQKLLSDQLAKNEGAEINAELEERLKKTQKLELDLRRENIKLKTENKWYSEQLNEAVKEIGQLKELLKEAKEIIEWYKADCGYRDMPTEVTLQHINQVLGEE